MRIALAQFDPALGEVDANLARMRELADEAAGRGADLIVFPELAAHGYWLGGIPEPRSISASDGRLAALTGGRADALACFHEDAGMRTHNSAAYISRGEVVHVHRKLYLPTYLIWEERKHYTPGQSLRAFDTRHGRTAVLICNDAWQPPLAWLAAQDGAELLLVPTNSASDRSGGAGGTVRTEGTGPEGAAPPSTEADPPAVPLDTISYWEQLLLHIARMQQCWVVFVNRVGIEEGTRFWGGSRVLDPAGEVVAEAPLWEPALVVADIDMDAARQRRLAVPLLAEARLGLVERELRRLIDAGGDA